MPFYPEYEKISGFAPEAARECTTVLDRANDQQGPIIFHNPDKKTTKCVRIHLVVRKIPGIMLLSHSQIYSTIAAGALNYRVREGNECFCSAMDTGKYKTKN